MEEIKRNTIKRLEEAGELFLSEVLYHQTTAKAGVANFVTQVDYRVQDYMVKALSDILPGSNIITEESNRNDYHFTRPTWILDPVDGTTNLMHQYRHSAISLALILDGQLSLSFIYNPFTREMFIGQNKKGAWLNDKPIRVSTSASLAESLICLEPHHMTGKKRSAHSKLSMMYLCGPRTYGDPVLQHWILPMLLAEDWMVSLK